MNRKAGLILLLVPVVLLLSYLLRSTFVGYDSYYFLCLVWGKMFSGRLVDSIFLFLPQNVFLLKLILCSLLGLNIFLTAKAGEVVLGKNGWLSGLALVLNPLFLIQSLWLEEEQFLFPLYFLAVLLFVLFIENKKKRTQTKLFLVGVILSLLGWMWILWFDLSIPQMHWFSEPEYIPFLATIPMFAALPGLAGYWVEPRLSKYKLVAIGVTLLALLAQKTAVFSAPFLAIGMIGLVQKIQKLKKSSFVAFCFVGLLVGAIGLHFPGPLQHELDAAEFAVAESVDLNKPIVNNWSYGYLIFWVGGETHNYAGGAQPHDFNSSVALVDWELDCKLLRGFSRLNVYDCPEKR